MQNINYLEKAKALIERQARTAALVIVPLAAAVSAHAGAILPTSNFSCQVTVASISITSCAGSDLQLADPGNGTQGVKFYTSGAQTVFSSGSSITWAFSSTGALTGGALPGSVGSPVSYDFTLGATSGSIASWNVTFDISDQTNFNSGNTSFGGSGTGTFSGSGSVFLPVGGAALGDTLKISVTIQEFVSASFSQYSLDVPTNSLDVNAAAVATPEPASVGFLATALGGLGLLWRRKRKK